MADTSPAAGDDAPIGPGDAEESAFLAEQKASEPAVSAPRAANGQEANGETGGSLPPLDDLVHRIPAPTRELIDELFRAKFVTVKRVPKSALKS